MNGAILLATTTIYSAAARLASALVACGARVEAVCPRHHPLLVSRWLSRAHRYLPLSGEASFAEAVAAAEPELVIPCDDRALALLLRLENCDALLARSLGPMESYRVLTARAPSMAAARAEGIAAPLTLAVPSLADLPAALAAVGLPCVMKSDFSWAGGGVRFVADAAEAEQAFAALAGPPSRLRSLARAGWRKDLHFLEAALHPVRATVNVQSLVEGRSATSVFAARDGVVLAAQHMDVLRSAGRTGPASLMARIADPVMAAAARKLAARFRLSGLHGLDFVRDRNGLAHLIEVNPRVTQICHLPLDGDLPAALIGAAARPPVTEARKIALFPQLLQLADLPPEAFCDLPLDDPAVLHGLGGKAAGIWAQSPPAAQ